jgi:hypothetical protein
VPLMRRRPLMRAAMVGGAAYYGGKHVQQNRYREEGQEQRIEELEAQQSAPMQPAPVMAAPPPAAAPPAAAPGGNTDDMIEQLTKLGQLRDSGVLTDDEFEQQKARLLA